MVLHAGRSGTRRVRGGVKTTRQVLKDMYQKGNVFSWLVYVYLTRQIDSNDCMVLLQNKNEGRCKEVGNM